MAIVDEEGGDTFAAKKGSSSLVAEGFNPAGTNKDGEAHGSARIADDQSMSEPVAISEEEGSEELPISDEGGTSTPVENLPDKDDGTKMEKLSLAVMAGRTLMCMWRDGAYHPAKFLLPWLGFGDTSAAKKGSSSLAAEGMNPAGTNEDGEAHGSARIFDNQGVSALVAISEDEGSEELPVSDEGGRSTPVETLHDEEDDGTKMEKAVMAGRNLMCMWRDSDGAYRPAKFLLPWLGSGKEPHQQAEGFVASL